MPAAARIAALRAAREQHDLRPLAIHANYLINLASNDSVIRPKSIQAFRAELERAAAIGAELLVVHPGSRRGRSIEEGIVTLVSALGEAARDVRAGGLTILFENTAGAGAHLGSRFEELQAIRELAAQVTDLPIGYCLDTCHLLAAGYDIASAAGLQATVDSIERTLGIARVHLIHANDSQAPRGSRVDRHAHIGEGYIGLEAFRRILRHPKLRQKPFILETPIDQEGDDCRNLGTLRRLAAQKSELRRQRLLR